jgi:hypothetical protein
MLLSFSLNQDLSCEKLCVNIQQMISKYQAENSISNSLVLTIDIKQVVDSDCNLMLKLEDYTDKKK